nr:TonB family protein [Burkholderiales bacterium]
ASLVVHAALAGLLPSPFHHDHPLPRVLDVKLVEVPPIPAPPNSDESAVQLPAPAPSARASPPKPERAPRPKPPTPPKPVRERMTAMPPSVPETEHLLTHAAPEKAVVSIPAPGAGTASREEKVAASETRTEGTEAAPTAPPSFRAGYLRNPEPQYPSASRRLGEQGTVQLRVLVSADGHAAHVDVHRSSGFPRLDDAAAAAVRDWRFVPAKRGTTPVEAHVIVPIVFKLEEE